VKIKRSTQPKSGGYYPPPSREEHFDFLVRCYFGGHTNLLRLCIHRAYLDFNRTLHGFAKHRSADLRRESGSESVLKLLILLRKKKIGSQREFDKWHEESCTKLRDL
jgi:hypothetical protein